MVAKSKYADDAPKSDASEIKTFSEPASASAPAAEPKPEKPAEKLVYIGPSLPRLGLIQFQVFVNGKPAQAEKAAETAPEIQHLFVPVERLGRAREALSRSGSREQRIHQAVRQAFNRK